MKTTKFKAYDNLMKCYLEGIYTPYNTLCNSFTDVTFLELLGQQDEDGNEIKDGDRISFFFEETLHQGRHEGTIEWNEDGYWEIMIDEQGVSIPFFNENISEIKIIGEYNVQ